MISSRNSSVIYVSQEIGNDKFSGCSPTVDGKGAGPIKTLKRLEEMINSMRVGDIGTPLTVRFMGDYEMDQSIRFGADTLKPHFGKDFKIADVTFESFGKRPARLIGGKLLKGFKKDTFNGAECISLHIPEVESGDWHFTDLYVNGKHAALSRYPKMGTLEGVTTENPDKWELSNGSKWFVAKKEDLENISGVEDAIVSFNHFWIDEHSPVESYDRESGKLVMKYRSRFMLTVDYYKNSTSDLHYYLENVAETFSEPGEWFLDVKKGMLYYIPKEDESLDSLEIIAPTLKHFAELHGTDENKISGFRFRNLEFIATKGDYASRSNYATKSAEETLYASDIQSCYAAYGAIRFENAEDCALENCRIICAGVHAVEINKGCDSIRIEGCHIEEAGAGGVKIWGTKADEAEDIRPTGHCVISGNHITNCSKRYAAGCGVLICHSAHNEVSNNEISNLEYSGVSVGWVWGYDASSTYGNIIKNNHIHHIGQGRLSDMGGIYLLGMQHGTVVSGNVIHDVTSSNYGGMGIYTDEGSSYITIENNVVFRCKECCYQHHFGKYNTLRGNVFAFGGKVLLDISRREDHTSLTVEENVFITDGKPIYLLCPQSGNSPSSDLAPSRNLYWDVSGKEPMMLQYQVGDIYFKDWKEYYGYDEESINQKPSKEVLKKVEIYE